MPKYMMKNGLKKHPFDGFRYKVLKNGMKIRENVSFIFEPNKIIDTGDFDLSNWVEARYLIEVKEEVKEEKSIDNSDEILENISIFSSDNVEFEKSEEDTEEEDTEEEDTEEEDTEDEDTEDEDEIEEKKYNNDIDDDNLKYDKIDDGFRCIICGKILKSEKRMNTHIKKKH